MQKTICDICKKEIETPYPTSIYVRKFAISSFGRIWDICPECEDSFTKWKQVRAEGDDIFNETAPHLSDKAIKRFVEEGHL